MKEPALSGLRITSLLLLLVTLLGWVWFSNTLGTLMHLDSFVMSVALLTGVLCSKKAYATNIRFFALASYSSAFLMTLIVLYGDFTRHYGADYGAIIIRLFMLSVLWALAKQALEGHSE